MSSIKIILYDIPSKEGRCNSPNTWKTRLLLNYKNIPYETKWLEYPDISPTLRGLGVSTHPEGASYTPYTLPAITIIKPDQSTVPATVMDSKAIASALEKLFPEPRLYVDSYETDEAEEMMGKLMRSSFAAYLPLIPEALNPVSAAYYRREREALFGAPLQAIFEAKGSNMSDVLEDSKEELEAWKQFFERDESGPFVRGKEVSYADMVFVGWLAGVREFSMEAWEAFVGYAEVFGRVLAETEPLRTGCTF